MVKLSDQVRHRRRRKPDETCQFVRGNDGTGETPLVATLGAPTLTNGMTRMIASNVQIKTPPSRIDLFAISRPSTCQGQGLLVKKLNLA
jgi:hypothetical protein